MTHGPELKMILVLVIVLLALGAGLPPLLRKVKGKPPGAIAWGEALAAGVFLGAGLIHMLGDADGDFAAAGVDYPWSMVICGAVMLALLRLEHMGSRAAQSRGDDSSALPLLGAVMLSIHSFLAGAAFGSSGTASVTLVIFVAVLAHKGAASFALGLQLSRSALKVPAALATFAIFVAMFPLGTFVGQAVTLADDSHPLLEPIFASLAAGTFLYLGTLHGLQDSAFIVHCRQVRAFGIAISGFGLMALVAIWT